MVASPPSARPSATSGTDRFFGYPDPVDEISVRLTAGLVAATAWLLVVTRWSWLTVPLAYGFLARVLTGPRLSPAAQLASRVLRPRLSSPPRPVPGPPKRFAQGIGAVLSVAALGCWVAGANGAVVILAAMVGVAATLESVFGFCLGCHLFSLLMRIGIIPESACPECADIRLRYRTR